MKVSIIIVTRNRKELLSKCLHPLIEQLADHDLIEVIVIDNKSTDDTLVFLENFTSSHTKFSYSIEEKVSASHARNKGISISNGEWLCFLDDDGIPEVNFIKLLLATITNYDFDGFGGMWYPYAERDIPEWIPKEVTTMHLLLKEVGSLPKGITVAAGICAFKKNIVLSSGCFPTEIGPRDGKMGYGEENYLQQKIWNSGGIIGFNPFWSMRHNVSDYKFSLFWNLKRFYLKGRDSNAYLPPLSFISKLHLSFKIIIVPIYLLGLHFPKLLVKKNYILQHWILDGFRYSFRIYGRITS